MNIPLVYIDTAVLVLAVLFSFVCTLQWIKNAGSSLRKAAVFFMVLGPAEVAFNMIGHTGDITYRAIMQAIAGSFKFNFHFYSLILMGLLFFTISTFMIRQIRAYTLKNVLAKKRFIQAAVVLSLCSGPLFFINPIGLLPVLACIISTVALCFARKTVKAPVMVEVA